MQYTNSNLSVTVRDDYDIHVYVPGIYDHNVIVADSDICPQYEKKHHTESVSSSTFSGIRLKKK